MVVVRVLWVRHGESLSQYLRSLGPAFLNTSFLLPDPGLTRVARSQTLLRGQHLFNCAPQIRAIFTSASMRSIQTAHFLRMGSPEPRRVGLYVGPYLAETIAVPENQPLLLEHPMDALSDYLELPSYVDPLLLRTDLAANRDASGGNFALGRQWIFQHIVSEGLIQSGETVLAVTHSCHMMYGFGLSSENLDIVEEYVELDHLGRHRTLKVAFHPLTSPLSSIAPLQNPKSSQQNPIDAIWKNTHPVPVSKTNLRKPSVATVVPVVAG